MSSENKSRIDLDQRPSIWGVGSSLNVFAIIIIIFTFILRIWFLFPFNLDIIIRILLIVIFILLFRLAFNWSLSSLPTEKRNKQLSIKGPYAYVRHPLYASFLYTIPPIIILIMSDLIFVLSWILYYIVAFIQVRKEEDFLVEIFGTKYIKYQKLVPALFFYKGAAGRKLIINNSNNTS